MDSPIPLNTNLLITCPNGELQGQVRYCVYRDIGYFLGVQFEPGSEWSMRNFKPMHLFDPRRLVKGGRPAKNGFAPPPVN